MGTLLTGIGLTVTHRLRPAAAPAPAAVPVAAGPRAGQHTEPPWTVPLPTVAPSTAPAPTPAPRRTTTRPRATITATPTPAPTSATAEPGLVLLGPAEDDTLEAALTSYCVHVRGRLAIAGLSYREAGYGDDYPSADGEQNDGAPADGEWGCRHGKHTTVLPMTAACQWFYGDDAWAKLLIDTDPYSWRCFRG